MFDNTLMPPTSSIVPGFPAGDNGSSFANYIAHIQTIICERRCIPKHLDNAKTANVLEANSPFECLPDFLPPTGTKYQYGALLIHGLLDSPFSLKDIALRLKTNNVLSRALLLPGHGTVPQDLLQVSYQDWIQTVRYGIDVMQRDVEKIFLIGYSTGAALSIYQALQPENRKQIAGLILLAPAIRIKAPVDIVIGWNYLKKWLSKKNLKWLYREKEIDYAKYHSITFNAVNQVAQLTNVIRDLNKKRPLDIPILMVMSNDDETISSHSALNYFCSLNEPNSKLLLYTTSNRTHTDKRIETRKSSYPELHIKNFSHVTVPFAADNKHYGQHGDYSYASHLNTTQYLYGAYNRLEEKIYNQLYQFKLIKHKHRELTYNPDFDYMIKQIIDFIIS